MPPKMKKKSSSSGIAPSKKDQSVRHVNRPKPRPKGLPAAHAPKKDAPTQGGPTVKTQSVGMTKRHKFDVRGNHAVGSECFYDLNVPPASTAPGLLNLVATNVNPQNATLFPVLSALAADYERFTIEWLNVEYIPNSNTSVNAKVALMFDYDAADVQPASIMELSNNESATGGGQATYLVLPLETKNNAYKQYFCSTLANITTDQDVRTKFPASLFIFLDHWGSSAAGTNLGQLWINYSVKFNARRPPAATSFSGNANPTSATSVTTPLLWQPDNSAGAVLESPSFVRASVAPTLAGSLVGSTCARDGGQPVLATSWPAYTLPAATFSTTFVLLGGASLTGTLYVGVVYFSVSNGAYAFHHELAVVNPTAGQQYDQFYVTTLPTQCYAVPYHYTTTPDASSWQFRVRGKRSLGADLLASSSNTINYALPSARSQLIAALADENLNASIALTTYVEPNFDDDEKERLLAELLLDEYKKRMRATPAPRRMEPVVPQSPASGYVQLNTTLSQRNSLAKVDASLARAMRTLRDIEDIEEVPSALRKTAH